eukprot:TRINITY_DN157_c0_g1_i3.p1 TRINITY_DN157_c0_g1~~TRINITY_DN157_c0_g1_i3.p1  ORF type:complete len:103 (+),score=13.68 TRINITY_DN157_c0_g1_i3:73-381(+)
MIFSEDQQAFLAEIVPVTKRSIFEELPPSSSTFDPAGPPVLGLEARQLLCDTPPYSTSFFTTFPDSPHYELSMSGPPGRAESEVDTMNCEREFSGEEFDYGF